MRDAREPEVAVTLPARLYECLAQEAEQMGIAVEWLVATLVAEVMDGPTLPVPATVVA